MSDDGAYVLGVAGFLTEEEMHQTLKVNFPLNFVLFVAYLLYLRSSADFYTQRNFESKQIVEALMQSLYEIFSVTPEK